jgi:hypothetical protein
MVIGEDRRQEDRSEARPRERRAQPRADVKLPLYEVGKCPYLAGRPPCGTHHLFPSGANVCWAVMGETKPYQGISREAQDRHCFGGANSYSGCDRYQGAVAAGVPLPQFERPPAGTPSGPEWALPPRPKPRRRADVGISPFRSYVVWIVPLTLTVLLMLMLLR